MSMPLACAVDTCDLRYTHGSPKELILFAYRWRRQDNVIGVTVHGDCPSFRGGDDVDK